MKKIPLNLLTRLLAINAAVFTITPAGAQEDPLPEAKTVSIPLSYGITLDGTADEGYSEAQPLDRNNNPEKAPPTEDILSATFRTATDSAWLYLFIEVQDDTMIFFPDGDDTPHKPFESDSIELVFDVDSSRGTADGVDDWRIDVAPQADGSLLAWPRAPWNPTGLDKNPRLEEGFEGLTVSTDTGYIVEMRMSLAKFDILPYDGKTIGFDLGINDDDTGGKDIEYAITWNNTTGINSNAMDWGNLQFEGIKRATAGMAFRDIRNPSITLDGAPDGAYGELMPLDRNDNPDQAPDTPENLSAEWGIAHDLDYVYIILKVTDDALSFYGDDAGEEKKPFSSDGIEFVFDANFSRGEGNLNNQDVLDDWRIEILPQHDGTMIAWARAPWNPDGGDTASTAPTQAEGWEGVTLIPETNDGWIVEFQFPKANYNIASTNGTLFGMDLSLNDDDDGGSLENQITWNTTEGVNRNAANWGIIELAGNKEISVPQVASEAIALDGLAEDGYSMAQPFDRTSNVEKLPPSEEVLSATFQVAHDNEYLYLLIDVTDDVIHYFPPADYHQAFNDDGIEMAFDWNLSKGYGERDAADGVDDWRYEVTPQADGTIIAWPRAPWNPTGLDKDPRLEDGWEGVTIITETGYIIELRFPFEKFGLKAYDGFGFGFDMALNDDDDGGAGADYYITWNNTIGINKNAVNWGTLVLESDVIVRGPFPGFPSDDANWFESTWLGWFWSESDASDWYYAYEADEWIYAPVYPDGQVFMWTLSDEHWLYADPSLYPWVYDYSLNEWIEFVPAP